MSRLARHDTQTDVSLTDVIRNNEYICYICKLTFEKHEF